MNSLPFRSEDSSSMSDNFDSLNLLNNDCWFENSNMDYMPYLADLNTTDLKSDCFDDLDKEKEPVVNSISIKEEVDDHFNKFPATMNLDKSSVYSSNISNFDGNITGTKIDFGQGNTTRHIHDLNEKDETLMPPPPNPTTQVFYKEELKEKRERNRIAARRCRDKKINKINELKVQVEKIKAENCTIELEVAKLSEHLRSLRLTLINYNSQNVPLKPESSDRP